MAEPSLGAGIGLGYRIPSSAGIINQLRQARKEEAMAIAEARKARAKDLADLEKYQGDVSKWAVSKQSGLLPVDQEIAKAKAQIVLDAAKSGDKTKVYEAQLELNKFADSAKMSAQNLMKQGQTGIEHPDKFTVRQEIIDVANSVGNPENYAKWQEMTGGTGFYMSGVLDPIDKTDWLEDMQKNVVGSGLKYQSVVDPITQKRLGLQAPSQAAIDNTWSQAKSQSWFTKALAQKTALGIDPSDAEAQIKKAFVTSIPKDVSVRGLEEKDKKGGGINIGIGGGSIGDINFSLAKQPAKAMTKTGEATTVEVGGDVLISREQGKRAPFISLKRGETVYMGLPRKITKNGTWLQMYVPKDKKISAYDFDLLTQASPPETQPDKYELIEVPLTSDENKKVFKQVLGGNEYYPRQLYEQLKGVKQEEQATSTLPLIKTKAEFDALPKGAKYTKADGKTYTKG